MFHSCFVLSTQNIIPNTEVPLKRKDQIALDEQIARDIQPKLDAELIEEQKLARKQEEEANIALIESIEADRLLAERLQSKEREELTDEEIESKEKKVEESSKKQKVEEEKESDEVEEVDKDDEVELKKLLVIKKDEDIAIDAIPLATKLPVIIDYKLLKE
ncbi:hypothetical protein Tco_0131431, partial [Tanacetum coccineum]